MPYIDEEARAQTAACGARNVGELTYELQTIICEYLTTYGLRYQQIAECLGALEGCKFDFLERVVKPYEQTKLTANGDVWPSELTDHGVAHTTLGAHPHLEDEPEVPYGCDDFDRGRLLLDIERPAAEQIGDEAKGGLVPADSQRGIRFGDGQHEALPLSPHQSAVLRGAGGDLRTGHSPSRRNLNLHSPVRREGEL